MSDGTFSIRARPAKSSEAVALGPNSDALRSSTYDFFLNGFDSIGRGVTPKTKMAIQGDADEFSLRPHRQRKLADHDKFLKKFMYSEALDTVLKKVRLHTRYRDDAKIHESVCRMYGRRQLSH